jgi:membrane associated rhomboid family serine protease
VIPLRDANPTRRRALVTLAIVIACGVAFGWELGLLARGDAVFEAAITEWGVVPARLTGAWGRGEFVSFDSLTLLSSQFLHGGWLHLLGNMLYLWVFGNNVEDAMGHGRFIAFYVICGIAAALAQAIPDPTSAVPMVGASGAISGVLGAYMLLYPHARVLLGLPLGFFIVQLGRFPAVWVLAAWFGMQLAMNLLTPSNPLEPEGGGVAFRAHIGGFLAGMILIPLFKRRGVRLWRARS